MPPRTRRARTYDPDRTAAALLAEAGALRDAVPGLPPDAAARALAAADGAEAAPAPGPAQLTAADPAVVRLVELTLLADELAVPHDRQALAATVRVLADALADRAPGGAVEVRVPPFAAVQCVAGPRHTRGTPPNVVETDPLTWLRLATGRLAWADALEDALVTAGGERADLSAYLPVPYRPPSVADHPPA